MTYLPKESGQLIQGQVVAEQYIQNDKQALKKLLRLGLADTLVRGKTLDLDTNEEISRIIPVLCCYFSREELVELIGEEVTTQFLDMHRTETLQNLFLEHEFHNVLHAFNEADIPLMLFKGPALAYTVYPDAHLRTYHDIDALIQHKDLERAHTLLTEMGYTFYEEFRSNVINSKRAGYNYTLKRPDSWLEVLIELHTAPHAGEITTFFDVEAMWAQAQPIVVLGEGTLTMNPVDHLLYLCWHYRFHGFSRLIWLYDVVVLLRALGTQEFDWEILIRSAHRQHLATTLYYCLTWSRDLFHVTIPDEVFTRLRPPAVCQLIIERTLPDAALALAATKWQPRRILAHRAMVDSTLELLNVGMRAFFPTPDILAQRYMEHSRLPLQLYFIYYLVHPWITLSKGLRYLGRRRQRGQSRQEKDSKHLTQGEQ